HYARPVHISIICLCLVSWYGHRPDLHSFPTRRSSDLPADVAAGQQADVTVDQSGVSLPDAVGFDVVFERRADDCPYGCIHSGSRSEEHTSELQSRENLVCRLLLEKKKVKKMSSNTSTD